MKQKVNAMHTVDGVNYINVPDIGCTGCVGEDYAPINEILLCRRLQPKFGCKLQTGWVKAPNQPTK